MSIIRGSGSNMFFRIAVLGSWGFRNIGGKAPVLESHFNKVAGLRACKFLVERLRCGCFPWRTDSIKERSKLSNCYYKNSQKKSDHEKLLKRFSDCTKDCKVHKQQVDGCPPFRPILSALQTPTYNLAKFLVPLLNPLTKNEYTVKDSFQFAEEICEQDPTLSMGSLDVDSLFTNIPLDETIDICVNQLFENTDTVEGFTKSELKQLLSLATKESYFIFNGLLYKQIDGVAMTSWTFPC